ncbi:MAG: AIPR family protein [Actinobacteria bacterium]|nr:AIPR family protein [Actinomycetota bacterium]
MLTDFCARQEIDPGDRSGAFEHFAAFGVLNAERLDQGEYQDALTDPGEEGLDAVAVIVNGVLVADPSDVNEIAQEASTLSVKYVFLQAKSSETWNGGEVLKFTRAVRHFFGDADIGTSAVVEAARQAHKAVLDHAAQLDENPSLKAYYVGTGKWDDSVAARKHLDELKSDLEDLDLFSSIQCDGIDGARLQQLYRSATSAATATVEFESKVTLPRIDGVEQAFLGVLPARELMKLLADDDGEEIRKSVFEDNVRDFQGGDAPVNARIRETINGPHRQQFAVLNNGVTIVVRELRVTANTFRLTDYQVVNGAQTSHVIFSSRDVLAEGQDILVPTRIIQTDDEDLITAIVTATNSQTEVKVDELNARAVSERNVEKFFAATKPPRNLLYERRSKQYDNQSNVVKARVIDRYTLVRATAATFADEPHLSTGYPMQLLSRLAGAKRPEEGRPRQRFFGDDDEPIVYYAAASAHYRLDLFFKTGRLEARLKPARWHLLRLARALALEGPTPAFENRKFRDWVKPFVDKVWSDKDGPALFLAAAEVVDSSGIELSRRSLRNTAATQDLGLAVDAVSAG